MRKGRPRICLFLYLPPFVFPFSNRPISSFGIQGSPCYTMGESLDVQGGRRSIGSEFKPTELDIPGAGLQA
jgi:hypothetical protein